MNKLLIFVLFSVLLFTFNTNVAAQECSICEYIVGYAETFLSSKSTEQDIENFLENSVCNLLPVSSWTQDCDNIVTQYLPDLVNIIKNEESPDVACTQIGFCSSTKSVKPMMKLNKVKPMMKLNKPTKQKDAKASIECTICEDIVGYAETFISSNSSEQEVEKFLDNSVCTLFNSTDQFICKGLVSNYPLLVNYIINRESPDVACTQVDLCTSSNSVKPMMKLNKVKPMMKLNKPTKQKDPKAAVGCTICEVLVTITEQELADNATEQEIESFLENKVCNLLPSIFGQECDNLVSQYLPALVQYIEQKESPDVACTQIGLCTSSKSVKPMMKLNKVRPMMKLNKVKPMMKLNKVRPMMKLNKVKPMMKLNKPTKQKDPKASIQCTICEVLLNLAEEELASNATEQEVESFLENKVCNLLPSIFGQECDNLVSQYLPALVQYIEQKESPDVACTQINLCTSSKSVKPMMKLNKVKPMMKLNKVKPMMKLNKPQDNVLECIACETLIDIAETYLGKNTTEQKVEDFLDNKACAVLPGAFKNECDILVAQFLPEITQFIIQDESGQKACTQLHVCPSNATKPLLKLNKVSKRNTEECDICQAVAVLARQSLSKDSTDQQISTTLHFICNHLGEPDLKKECNDALTEFLASIENDIHNGDNLQDICTRLQICPSH